MRHKGVDGDIYTIHEVHYENNVVTGWTEWPATPIFEDQADDKTLVDMYFSALDKPALCFETGKEVTR